jgi:hypothetical protein
MKCRHMEQHCGTRRYSCCLPIPFNAYPSLLSLGTVLTPFLTLTIPFLSSASPFFTPHSSLRCLLTSSGGRKRGKRGKDRGSGRQGGTRNGPVPSRGPVQGPRSPWTRCTPCWKGDGSDGDDYEDYRMAYCAVYILYCTALLCIVVY